MRCTGFFTAPECAVFETLPHSPGSSQPRVDSPSRYILDCEEPDSQSSRADLVGNDSGNPRTQDLITRNATSAQAGASRRAWSACERASRVSERHQPSGTTTARKRELVLRVGHRKHRGGRQQCLSERIHAEGGVDLAEQSGKLRGERRLACGSNRLVEQQEVLICERCC